MPRVMEKRSQKAGLPPGSVVHVGEKKTDRAKITVLDYDEAQFHEAEVQTVGETLPFKNSPTVTWINVDGIHEVEILDQLGDSFGLHPLVVEDIANTDQRPKTEDFGDYIYVVLRMLQYEKGGEEVVTEQTSLILGERYVLSFQERPGDVFDPVRERIRSYKGRIRRMGADYLAYTLIDSIVDNYFVVLERLGEEIESLEEELVTNPMPETLQTIHELKREMIFLRKSVWPLREVINALERGESSLIQESTGIYLRDVYDHTIQVIDAVETLRDMISGMLDIYLSSISNRMNEVMKVLTIIATIFIPLTLIAGIYGMNFRYMPELEWRWGYFMVWLVMLAVGISMVVYFRRRKWL
ncbi:MAG: magnesium/cobalt transporter CorA [Anaerolineae bacterium]